MTEKRLSLQQVTGFLAFLLIPFLGGNHLSLYVITIDKFWIETTFVLLLAASLFARYLAGERADQGYLRFCGLILPLLALCAGSLAYTWSSLSTLNELNVLAWGIGAAILYLTTERKDILQKALIVGSLLLVLSAVLQLCVLLPELTRAFAGGKYGVMVRDQVAPFGAFLNQNMLGGYFLYTLPLAFYFAVAEKKWIYLLAASALMVGILLSLSRLAMIIGFAGLVGACAFSARTLDPKWLLKTACACGCAVLLFALLLSGERRDQASSMRSLMGTKVAGAATEIQTLDKRTEVWSTGLSAFLSRPMFGYGAGTFEYALRKFYDGGLYTKYAHSSVVKMGVELGAAGLICFLLYLAGFFLGAVKLLHDVKLRFVLLSALAGLLFSLVDFAFDMPAHVITFLVVSSLFVVSPGPVKPARVARPVLLSVVLLLLVSFGFTARADLSRKLIEDGILNEEAGLVTEAYVSYRDAIQSMPLNHDGYARVLAILTKSHAREEVPGSRQRLRSAIAAYLEDLTNRHHADAELYMVQGAGYGALGEGREACRHMETAVRLHPASAQYVFETASCYARAGDAAEALATIRKIEPYLPKFRVSGNPQGLFVYKIRDLEADIEYGKGNLERALVLGRENLFSGMSEHYTISDTKAREFSTKELLIAYLTRKVAFYEGALKSGRREVQRANGV